MATFTWIPASGPSITFGSAPPYILRARPTGISGSPEEHRLVRAPYQHGATLVDTRRRERIVTIPLTIWADTEAAMWAATRNLHVALNSSLGLGRLQIVVPGGKTYEIKARPDDGTPMIGAARIYAAHDASIDLLCPHPLFYDPVAVETTFLLGQDPQQHQKTLVNLGDEPAAFEVTFHGPVNSPRIALNPASAETMKLIRVEQEIIAGEQIVVTTGFGAPSVVVKRPGLPDEGAAVSLQSEFFLLDRGDNVVSYTSIDSEVPDRGAMVVRFHHYYRGL